MIAAPDQWQFPGGAPIATRMTPLADHTETEVCAPCHARRAPLGDGHDDRPAAARRLPPLAARSRPLPRRRPDGRRGLQLRLVPAEQDVRGRGDLLELPRAAQPEAAGRGQCGLRAVPPAQRVRHAGAPFPHGRASPAANASTATCRPRPTWWSIRATITAFACRGPDLASRDRCAGCLHQLPCRQGCRLGRGAHRRVVRARAPPRADVRRGAGGRPQGRPRARRGAWSRWPTIRPRPAIARATAVAALERHLDQPAVRRDPARRSADPDPLVRLARGRDAGRARSAVCARRLALPLLHDPVRAVRLEAARVLAPVRPWACRRSARAARGRLRRIRGGAEDSCSTGPRGC